MKQIGEVEKLSFYVVHVIFRNSNLHEKVNSVFINIDSLISLTSVHYKEFEKSRYHFPVWEAVKLNFVILSLGVHSVDTQIRYFC